MAGRRSEGLTTRRPGTPQDLAIMTKSGYTSFSSLEVWYSPSWQQQPDSGVYAGVAKHVGQGGCPVQSVEGLPAIAASEAGRDHFQGHL